MMNTIIEPNLKRGIQHACIRCGRQFPHGFTPRCPICEGLVEVTYNLENFRLRESDRVSLRYADLLPVRDPANLLSCGEGDTPCLHAMELGRSMGLSSLFLKVESQNPTGTTKDRMAAIVLSTFAELGLYDFVSCSTGNSSSALAYGILAHPQFQMHLYIGGEFADRVRFVEGNAGVSMHVLKRFTFSEAFTYAKQEARRRHVPFEAGFFNPARREGLKLAFFEAVDQLGRPIHWYFQAASSAMGLYGTWKGAGELLALGRIQVCPRMVCVQQATCCPMVRAYESHSSVIRPCDVFHRPQGIAKAILRGDPGNSYPYVYKMVIDSRGACVEVSESEIIQAKEQVAQLEGLGVGFSSAAVIAAARKLATRGTVSADETVLLNLTD